WTPGAPVTPPVPAPLPNPGDLDPTGWLNWLNAVSANAPAAFDPVQAFSTVNVLPELAALGVEAANASKEFVGWQRIWRKGAVIGDQAALPSTASPVERVNVPGWGAPI